jgi:small subunit ribosomal protein S21
MSDIKLRRGESIDRALRRLKKKVDREGTIKEVRERRSYTKPSVRKRERKKRAKFDQMLRERENQSWLI